MGDRQPQLNGAYYGPSVLPPPPPPRYHHRRSSDGCCCACNPFSCLCKCIFNLIFKLIFTAIIILGLVVLILWLIFRPNPLKFHITDASLTQFDFDNSTLKYNLAFNASVRNTNARLGVYYDVVQVNAFYRSQRFGTVYLTPFYQGHKNTSDVKIGLVGQQVVEIDSKDFESDKSAGVFEVELRMRLRVRLRLIRLLKIRVGKFKGQVYCDIKVPISGSGAAFQATRCDVYYI